MQATQVEQKTAQEEMAKLKAETKARQDYKKAA